MEGDVTLVRFCKVLWVDDDADANRIKVRLNPEDNSLTDSEIIADDDKYVFPLLPQFVHIKPKVGEAVFVFLSKLTDGNSQRQYIGPVISQSHRLWNDPFFMGADSYQRGSYKKFDTALSMKPEAKGVQPNNDDISIIGRKNCDIQITDDDIRIKAGVKICDENNKQNITFNTKNPSYAKFKYHPTALSDGTQSTATIVADKINLLGTSSPYSFKMTDREALIDDEELSKVIESAYKLPYGEKLVEFLKVFTDAFIKHTHPYPMLPPVSTWTTDLSEQKAKLLDNGELLSDTVRFN